MGRLHFVPINVQRSDLLSVLPGGDKKHIRTHALSGYPNDLESLKYSYLLLFSACYQLHHDHASVLRTLSKKCSDIDLEIRPTNVYQ